MINHESIQVETIQQLLSGKTTSTENELRENYQSLMEVTRLLLKQVDQLNQAFKVSHITHQSESTKETLQKKISEALEICDILRSAADLGKSPNEMIGYYLLEARRQADNLAGNIEPSRLLYSETDGDLGEVAADIPLELSVEARRYAGSQREEMVNQRRLVDGMLKKDQEQVLPLLVTKKNELKALEDTINDQMDTLREQFDLKEE